MTDEELVALYEGGAHATDIAKEHGLSYDITLRRLREAGVEIRPYKTPRNPQTEEAIRLYETGLSAREAAARTGIDPRTVWGALRRYGRSCHRKVPLRKFTKEEQEEIRKGYEAGETVSSIGRRLHRAQNNVTDVLKRLGIYVCKTKPIRRVSEDEKEHMRALYVSGVPASKIAQDCDRPVTTVTAHLKRLGVYEDPGEKRKAVKAEILRLHEEGYTAPAIADEMGVGRTTVYRELSNLGLRPASCRPQHDESFWFTWTAVSAYWLGFLLADGCIMDRGSSHALQVSLAQKDEKHLQQFLLDYNAETNTRETRKVDGDKTHLGATIKITLTEAETQHLANHGLVPNKTEGLDLSILGKLPEHVQRDALRGYIDGDGCVYVSKKGRCWSAIVIVGTEASMKFVHHFFDERIRTGGHVGPDKRSKWLWQCRWIGSKAARACQYIYSSAERALERKRDKARLVWESWDT